MTTAIPKRDCQLVRALAAPPAPHCTSQLRRRVRCLSTSSDDDDEVERICHHDMQLNSHTSVVLSLTFRASQSAGHVKRVRFSGASVTTMMDIEGSIRARSALCSCKDTKSAYLSNTTACDMTSLPPSSHGSQSTSIKTVTCSGRARALHVRKRDPCGISRVPRVLSKPHL